MVAADIFAGAALLLHTNAPMIVDARQAVVTPQDDVALAAAGVALARRILHAAAVIRTYSQRQARQLTADHGLRPERPL